MKIQAISNQSFSATNFRLPYKFVKPNLGEISAQDKYILREEYIAGNFVKEYKNPRAGEYFNKALEANNIEDKLHYLDLMGDYKIVDISLEQTTDKFIKSIDF